MAGVPYARAGTGVSTGGGNNMRQFQRFHGLFATVALSVGLTACGQDAASTTTTTTDEDVGGDVIIAADATPTVDAGPDTDVFDPTGALGFAKAYPLPYTDLPKSRFNIPTTFRVGQFQEGVWVLPNGRLLTPAGTQVALNSFPLGVKLHPNGKWLYISNDMENGQSVQVFDIATGKIIQNFARDGLYRALAFSPDQQYLYAAGGANRPAWRMKIGADGQLSDDKTYQPADGFVGIALAPDGKTLYGVSTITKLTGDGAQRLAALDVETGKTLFTVKMDVTPSDVVVSADGKFAYVLGWRQGRVQRVDLTNPQPPGEKDVLTLGSNGEGIRFSPDGKSLWVSLVDADQMVEIDVATLQVLHRIPVGSAPGDQPTMAPRGRDPGFFTLSADGKRLYVVCAMSNEVRIIDTDKHTAIGSIPVGWYPSGIDLSADGKTIYVGNAKGTGIPPWDGTKSVTQSYLGTLSIIPTPDDAAAKQGELDVLDNMVGVTGKGRLPQPDASKLVLPPTGVSPKIKHVVYLMRENKTFDVELGDIATPTTGTIQADPKYAIFGQEFTPNLHKLASNYCVLDNFYTDGDYSATGHGYAVATKPSDYIEKWYMEDGADSTWNVGEPSKPGQLFLFQNILAYGYTAADFGEIVGTNDPYIFANVLQPDFPGVVFNFGVLDVDKADFFAEWLQTHELPTFTFILLPNNHTCCGGQADKPSPRSMIADNDLGTGKVIEALTKSKYWNETVAFIFEDDPQDGGDSVAYHRSPLVVVSPWVKKGTVVHDHHATGSIHATMERMLDITPLTELDALASPIYGCFGDTASTETYDHMDRLYPPTLNKDEKKVWNKGIAEAWEKMDFTELDENRGLGRVLWEMYTGTKAPWPKWMVSREGEDVDD